MKSLVSVKDYYQRGLYLISLILVFLTSFTLIAENNDWDRRLTSLFYDPAKKWIYARDEPWQWLYDYGPYPGVLLSLYALLFWYLNYSNMRWAKYRTYLLVYGLTPIIASGLLANVLLKDHTGRPRPRQITEFGGTWEYKPVFKVGVPGKGYAFPCGHCSIAYVLTGGIVFWRQSRKIALGSLFLGLGYGMLMSAARILQGGHFLTDTVWALGVVWITLAMLYYFVFQPPLHENIHATPLSKKQKWKIFSGIGTFLIAVGLFTLLRRPFYEDFQRSFKIPEEALSIEVKISENWELLPIIYEDRKDGNYHVEITGFTPPSTRYKVHLRQNMNQDKLVIQLEKSIQALYSSFKGTVLLRLPKHLNADTK